MNTSRSKIQKACVAFCVLLACGMALGQPTNAPALKLVSVTVGTNSALIGYGTNLFSTNIGLVRAAGIVAPTNAGSDGQVVSLTGNNTKWVAQSAGGSQTPWTSDINAATYSLTNATLVKSGQFEGTGQNVHNFARLAFQRTGAGNSGYGNTVFDAFGGANNTILGTANSVNNTMIGGVANSFDDQWTTVQYGNIFLGGVTNRMDNGQLRAYRGSVVLGGQFNRLNSATASLVAGNKATNSHHNTFVFSAAQDGMTSAQTNTFIIGADNGVGINTNNPGTNALLVRGNVDSTVGFSVNGVPITGGAYRVFASTNEISNTGTDLTNLYSFTLPANTLNGAMQSLEFWVAGDCASAGGLSVSLGDFQIITNTLPATSAPNDDVFWLEGKIIYITSTLARFTYRNIYSPGNDSDGHPASQFIHHDFVSIGLTTNNTLIVKGHAGATGTIRVRAAKGIWYP